MNLSQEAKRNIFQSFGAQKSAQDTGSAESQVALFTHRIKHLTEHLKSNKKDTSTRLGLTKLVGKRKRFLSYLKQKDLNRYRSIIADLGLRK